MVRRKKLYRKLEGKKYETHKPDTDERNTTAAANCNFPFRALSLSLSLRVVFGIFTCFPNLIVGALQTTAQPNTPAPLPIYWRCNRCGEIHNEIAWHSYQREPIISVSEMHEGLQYLLNTDAAFALTHICLVVSR